MKFSLVLASCAVLANAAPSMVWSTELAVWYRTIGQHIQEFKDNKKFGAAITCDVSKEDYTVMFPPETALPKPNGTLVTVVLGRGVQNYTCDSSKPGDAPKAVGAIARLYDASCYTNFDDLLHQLPAVSLQMPLPKKENDPLAFVANLPKVGHHYFNAAGVPTFDLNDNGSKLGVFVGKLDTKVPAPAGAPKGQFDKGNGSVPWLLLKTVPESPSQMRAMYRIDTAGGAAPATCQDSPSAFSVEYATLYYAWTN